MNSRRGGLGSRQDRAKRIFDVAVAASLLFLLSPLLAALALVIGLRLGWPVLYRQQRPGLGGEAFTIYKFRTMVSEATDADGNRIPSIHRTPPWAHRIRALSLDELPELWNVLKGDMSLVGPRPLMMHYLPRYSEEQARRHEVRPGITGLAQISGRNAITWEQRFALDVEYVDGHDLGMDVDILVRTVATVLSREGVRHSDQMDMPEFMGTQSHDTDGGQG